MKSALIIGSGPAAAATALALSRRDDLEITVIDIGLQLDEARRDIVEQLAAAEPAVWEASLVQAISALPAASTRPGVPEKRSFGSDYPFRNVGQLDGVTALPGSTNSLISPAYGGFSNVWGAQLMPFTARAFDAWPFSAAEIAPHYEAVLGQIPYAAEVDDLAMQFPLMQDASELPQLSDRADRVLARYARRQAVINRRGVTVGKARLALRADQCLRCRLCMTGCPYHLVYSAGDTFDALRRAGRITYHGGLLAVNVAENANSAVAFARELATGQTHRFEADRVFVACGAMGTTRLVAASLKLFGRDLPMLESQQFVLPAISLRPSEDPRGTPDFTLNQFNMIVESAKDPDLSQLHFYAFNPAFVEALPMVLRARLMAPVQVQLLRRLSVALGYLPSWRSPRLFARIDRSASPVGEIQVRQGPAPAGRGEMLRSVLTRLSRVAPLLDLYPLLPMVRFAAGGRSYHFGGSFPHSLGRPADMCTDLLGRAGHWKRVHLVDASVFPTIPAMTFTLTIMANAHRIASATLELPS